MKNLEQLAICSARVQKRCKTLVFPYPFITNDDLSVALGDLHTSGSYAQNSLALRAVSFSVCLEPASFARPHFSGVADAQNCVEDVIKDSIDVNITGRKVAARSFDLQNYRREEVRVTIFQIDAVQNPLRAVSQKHDDDLLEPLRACKYQQGAGLVTLTSPAWEKFGAVHVDSMLEHCENERFLRDKIFLAVGRKRHRHSCNQKLVSS